MDSGMTYLVELIIHLLAVTGTGLEGIETERTHTGVRLGRSQSRAGTDEEKGGVLMAGKVECSLQK